MTTVRQPMRRPTRLNWLPVGVDEVDVPASLRLGSGLGTVPTAGPVSEIATLVELKNATIKTVGSVWTAKSGIFTDEDCQASSERTV